MKMTRQGMSRTVSMVLMMTPILTGGLPALASILHPPEPFCDVTETSRFRGPYADEPAEPKHSTVPFRWVQGSISSGFAKAESQLPEGGRAELKIEPGYGLKFHTLTITSADGRAAKVRTRTPWYPLTVVYPGDPANQLIQTSTVSTELELSRDSTRKPGGSPYYTDRRVSVECFFNPLTYPESP